MPEDCAPSAAASEDENFDLTSFLEGHTRAWGIFEDRFGRVRRRLAVEMYGRWQGSTFFLDERFTYDTGASETRVWRLTRHGHGKFEATCADCPGSARGQCHADSVHMAYAFRLNLENRTVVVTFDDRIYRISPTTAVNRARISKWGIRLGELSLFFVRIPAPEVDA